MMENDTTYHDNHYFTVNHDININFSIHLKAFLEGLIEPIIKGPLKFHEHPTRLHSLFKFNYMKVEHCYDYPQ